MPEPSAQQNPTTPDPAEQSGLFVVQQPPVRKVTRKSTSNAKPTWTRYRPVNVVKCDDCMLVLFLAKGEAPASRPARWKRKQGGEYLLLCYQHAELRREEDGLKSLKGRD